MLANVFFRDIFAHLFGGILPQTLATGTTSGSAIPLGGNYNKIEFRAQFASGSAAASASMYLATASVSSGTFTSVSQTLVSAVISAASQYWLEADTRNEAFANLALTGSTSPLYVKVVIVLTGAACPMSLDVLGWECGNDPASNYDASGVAVTAVSFY